MREFLQKLGKSDNTNTLEKIVGNSNFSKASLFRAETNWGTHFLL